MSFEEQIMSNDKYPSIVLGQIMGAIVSYPSNAFPNTHSFEIQEYHLAILQF